MKWLGAECTISRAQLKALIEFVCKDPSKASIQKICFDPQNASAVATDGHTLLMLEDTNPEGTRDHVPFYLGVEDAKRIAKSASAKVDLCFSVDGEHLFVVSAGIDFKLKAADSFFPSYAQVLPERKSGSYHTEPAIFNALYLQRLVVVSKALREERDAPTGARMQPGAGPLDPIRFDIDDHSGQHTRAVIVIMPRL